MTLAAQMKIESMFKTIRHSVKAMRYNKWVRENNAKQVREAAQERYDFDTLLFTTLHISSLEKIDERMFYDSTWKIVFLENSRTQEIVIVRRDTEKRLPLLKLLAEVKSVEAIKALDERHVIYYD